MSNKVTKKQLLRIIHPRDYSRWKEIIDAHWPWWRWKIPVVEIVERGIDLDGVLYRDLHCVAKNLDAERMERLVPPNAFPPYETIKHYLWGNEEQEKNVHP